MKEGEREVKEGEREVKEGEKEVEGGKALPAKHSMFPIQVTTGTEGDETSRMKWTCSTRTLGWLPVWLLTTGSCSCLAHY